MKVLVACEFSGVVRDAFIAAGHDAISCDLLPSLRPGPHIQGDVTGPLRQQWDLVIAHPPCTYLTNSGARWLYDNRFPNRWQQVIDGAVFFRACLDANAPRVAVENPIMHGWAAKIIGSKATQVVQPWMFGHLESKATGLWLKGLPALQSTKDVGEEVRRLPRNQTHRVHFTAPSSQRGLLRSVTPEGIAAAMAKQWGAPDLLTLAEAAA